MKPLEQILLDNGDWPLTVPSDKWNSQSLSWQAIHENFAKRTGISALFEVTVETDRSDSAVHILSVNYFIFIFETGLNEICVKKEI